MTVPALTGPAVSGQTRLACIIGSPVAHSLSPLLHNAAFAATGLDWIYVAFDVAPGALPEAVEGLRALGIGGASVTMPHKQAVVGLLDEVSDQAQRIGAVNTILGLPGGRLRGDNTDGPGFLRFLERDAGIVAAGIRVLVLGAGGAARGLSVALSDAGASVKIAARNLDASTQIAAVCDAKPIEWAERADAAREVTLIVNATSLHSVSPLPIEALGQARDVTVVDLAYVPDRTALLDLAEEAGAKTHNGLGLLLHQAVLAFEAWTGIAAPEDEMRSKIRKV